MQVTWMLAALGHLLHSWNDLIWVAGAVVTVLPIPTQLATLGAMP